MTTSLLLSATTMTHHSLGQMTTTQIQDEPKPYLALKVEDWKKIASTDGSCIPYDHQQIIGAGVYIPDTNKIHHMNPK